MYSMLAASSKQSLSLFKSHSSKKPLKNITFYPGRAYGLVVIVLAYYSDNPRSSPDCEPNLDFVFLNIISPSPSPSLSQNSLSLFLNHIQVNNPLKI